ncbi:hypothetical protein QOZ80_6AG0542180 [Eleusine coracana subsp. coracana]|nr:hypothetical protein QOZ80_6AG0542180 [Eleusine coracana subsp. coracana]
MASSPSRRPLLVLTLLLATLSWRSVLSEAPAMAPAVAAERVARQEFHVAPAADDMSSNGNTRSARRGRGGGGTGAWTFSAMLPRGFVPPSGSSACHNDMPATAGEAEFFDCGGAGSP